MCNLHTMLSCTEDRISRLKSQIHCVDNKQFTYESLPFDSTFFIENFPWKLPVENKLHKLML